MGILLAKVSSVILAASSSVSLQSRASSVSSLAAKLRSCASHLSWFVTMVLMASRASFMPSVSPFSASRQMPISCPSQSTLPSKKSNSRIYSSSPSTSSCKTTGCRYCASISSSCGQGACSSKVSTNSSWLCSCGMNSSSCQGSLGRTFKR